MKQMAGGAACYLLHTGAKISIYYVKFLSVRNIPWLSTEYRGGRTLHNHSCENHKSCMPSCIAVKWAYKTGAGERHVLCHTRSLAREVCRTSWVTGNSVYARDGIVLHTWEPSTFFQGEERSQNISLQTFFNTIFTDRHG
jgi:hypothetical protein